MADLCSRATRSHLASTADTRTGALYAGRIAVNMINIAVQPPTQVQAGAVLYPPLVLSSESDAAYDFVQVILLDPYGHVLEDQLYGTLSTSKKALEDGTVGGSSQCLEFAVFPDLTLSYSGSYTLRVNAIRMDYSCPDGPAAVIVMSVTTREIYVYDQRVASEIPSSEEKTLLSRLRRSRGFGVPRPPGRR
ncbi:Uu.00g061750.m01.CDS01 [Anthostomella pinea]|uniref:Uu.00g061750.m01.CDS01 n=1 Tax=Anthostomella pinea TaxID=933095 RepID=A0AAI8VSI6_9PEZI|nr:Uu.00g061750.m01.CDS01 [Anthostomella pinea]